MKESCGERAAPHLDLEPYAEAGNRLGVVSVRGTGRPGIEFPGMHWSEHGALAVRALRATDLNGHWHNLWTTLTLNA